MAAKRDAVDMLQTGLLKTPAVKLRKADQSVN